MPDVLILLRQPSSVLWLSLSLPTSTTNSLHPVIDYAAVTRELCEHGKTRAIAPFPNWESAGVYFCLPQVSNRKSGIRIPPKPHKNQRHDFFESQIFSDFTPYVASGALQFSCHAPLACPKAGASRRRVTRLP